MKILSHVVFVTLLLLSNVSCYKVFLEKGKAHHVLRKRANSFLEEILPGNLERECYEETCSREEAREIFKSQEKTAEFWYHYQDLSPCKENPCRNGGICQQYHYTYTCLCPPLYAGRHCENARQECWYRNGGCHQYCRDNLQQLSVTCSCANGYTLEEDGKKCAAAVKFPCGLPVSSLRSLQVLEEEWDELSNTDYNITTPSIPRTTPTMSTPTMSTPRSSNQSLEMSHSNATAQNQTTDSNYEQLVNNGSATVSPRHARDIDNGTRSYKSMADSGTMNKSATNMSYNNHKNLTVTLHGFTERLEDGYARIVGGMLCELGQCPWQVLIRTKRGVDFCGGSLISDRWVLSAAHCFEDVVPHHVTIGDYDKNLRDRDEQKIAVLQVFSHPYYLGEHYDHDIALLYLRSPVVFGDYSRPICLPSPNLGRLLTQEGAVGQVSGWGSTRFLGRASRFLLKVQLPVISQEACLASTDKVLTGNMFCAGYSIEAKDACKGDSGGPFAVFYRNTWYLVGVVSWGEGCAEEGKYGVYTRVSSYISWIKDTIIETEGFEESLVQTL